ncbi:MAG TPA: gluconokinase [Candidatus Limnocylindrales bacterium]|nr:gluconokinase [Candidatus Limnocylindrales bacterium]
MTEPSGSPGDRAGCIHVLVMGVSGSGKSTIAAALAETLGLEMIEGDEQHPPANVAKMEAGIPLTDEDRQPWLARLAGLLMDAHQEGRGTVLACSALRRAYRDRLRAAVPADESFIVELEVDAPTLATRMAARKGHFMPVTLLESQLETLERLEPDEVGAIVDASVSIGDVTAAASRAIRTWLATRR